MSVDALRDAIERARPHGHAVSAWSLYVGEMVRASIGTKDRDTGGPHAPLELSEAMSARYRLVWDDGLVSRGALARYAIEHDAPAQLAAAREAAFDDPDGRDVLGPGAFPEVAIHDSEVAAAAGGDVSAFVPRLSAIREQVRRHGIRTWSGSLHATHGTARVTSSAGLDVSAHGTTTSWSATLDGELGGGHASRALGSFRDFEDRLERLVRFVLAMRAPSPARRRGDTPVLLHPDVVEEYVLGVLLHNLDGSLVAHGTGAFGRSQFENGATVLREDLTLRFDPLVPMAVGAYRFTQEGLPARPCTYVEAGRLKSPILDLKHARRLGLDPTPAPSAMDTVFLEGPRPIGYDDALAAASGGALVLSVLGVHTQDFTSGDFSLSAPQTLTIGGSRIDGRLRATISGNVFEALRSPDLTLVRFPGEHTPGMLIRCRLDPV